MKFLVGVLVVGLLACCQAGEPPSSASDKHPTDSTPTVKQTGQQEESQNSFRIFFILCVLLVAILMVFLLIKFNFHYLPESIAIVLLGQYIIDMLFLLGCHI